MPLCKISNDVSLYYITNSPKGDVTDFDYTKPTIILLPPMFSSVTWLREQFGDSRLSSQYNLIAFDARNMGHTISPPSPKRDTWVDAVDVALAHEQLQLPPCHVFATAMTGTGAALRMAMLFPDKCLSLGLCAASTQAGEDPAWVLQGYPEVIEAFCFPQDLDTLERACMEFSWFLFNGQVSTELEDEIVAWWQVNQPPTKRTTFLAQGLCGMHRHRFTDKELASVKQPTIFIQGDMSLHCPPHAANEINKRIPDSRMFIVKGGPEYMSVVPQYASVVNRVYCQFLKNLPDPPFFQPSQPDLERVSKAGLGRLSALLDDPSIAKRDPTTPLSFCCLSPETIEENAELLAQFVKDEKEAFHALDKHGKPIRKFSERNVDQWTPAAFARMQEQPAVGLGVVTVVESSVST